MLGKVKGTKVEACPRTAFAERWFKVQIGGQRSRRWTKEADLPDVVVRLYDNQMAAAEASPGSAAESTADDGGGDEGLGRTILEEVFGTGTSSKEI